LENHNRRCTDETYFLYCDEAGNSGPNYLDQDQPVHILAGFAVPATSLTAYRAALAEALARRRQATELHGVDLMRSPSGQRCIATFLRAALDAGCEPLWSAAEKQYCVAAKIVETFFDPFTNPAARWLPTGANADRQKVAEIFNSLSLAFLKPFLDAYREPTEEGLRGAAESLYHAMRLTGPPVFAWTLAGAVKHMRDITEDEDGAEIDGKRYIGVSLNLPVFVQFMTHADRFLKERGATNIEVVHDETSEFEAGFRWAFDVFASAKEQVSIPLQNGEEVYFGLSSLRNFRTGKSEVEPEIQGADLLASALRTIFIALVRNKPMPPTVKEMARMILGRQPESAVGNLWIVGSSKLWRSFGEHYREFAVKRSVG
jgi:hypothetical protein